MAIGAMSAAQQRGLQVGVDIAITGFDDTSMSEHAHPPLTTVHQPVYKIGGRVCEMLVQIIRGETPKQAKVVQKPSLVVRQSSAGSIG
jgi:DNA-binding LacI/PurR family transcriptional regulator